MHTLTRRRFLTISATAAGLLALPAHSAPVYQWRGIALGAEAAIYLSHPDAPAIALRAAAEIARLEAIFSLYRSDSALSQLNTTGRLEAPPFELLECLALCSTVHKASGGVFDPTVQPLWALYAARYSAGEAPSVEEIAEAHTLVDWSQVAFDSDRIQMPLGMALTLNGIAQGLIADRVAAMLRAEGLDNLLVNTGEFHAVGHNPDGGGWPVSLAEGGAVHLSDRGLATSATLGTVFDSQGRVGHIIDPRTGKPVQGVWSAVSVSAPSAALADALSTAICLLKTRPQVDALIAEFDGAVLEALV